jgi:NAD(P)-dependent dehydrogenase (short-subunit alcohol dehydrogenase family)
VFHDIKTHPDLQGLALVVAVWCIKHAHRTAFDAETADRFGASLQTYVTGAMVFAQLCAAWMLSQQQPPVQPPSPPRTGAAAAAATAESRLPKRGTLIFTGTLGVRMLAQSLAREYSGRGMHVVHAIANGAITDAVRSDDDDDDDAGGQATGERDEGDDDDEAKVARGEKMRAESVGRLYLQLVRQQCDLWVHELDMRPAAEKFGGDNYGKTEQHHTHARPTRHINETNMCLAVRSDRNTSSSCLGQDVGSKALNLI